MLTSSRASRRLPNPSSLLTPSSRPLFRRTFFSAEARIGLSDLAQALRPIRNTRSTVRPSPQGPRKPRNGFVRFNGTRPKPDPTPHLHSPEPSLSLSQRLKKLSKEYGWTALGVYLALSVLDFPFCFLAVRLLGTERIGRWEHVIIDGFWSVVYTAFPQYRKQREVGAVGEDEYPAPDAVAETNEITNSGDDASLWTQLVLAYAVHKSFIFIRVPLAAAILPKVVKTLRGWGWNIGKKAARKA